MPSTSNINKATAAQTQRVEREKKEKKTVWPFVQLDDEYGTMNLNRSTNERTLSLSISVSLCLSLSRTHKPRPMHPSALLVCCLWARQKMKRKTSNAILFFKL